MTHGQASRPLKENSTSVLKRFKGNRASFELYVHNKTLQELVSKVEIPFYSEDGTSITTIQKKMRIKNLAYGIFLMKWLEHIQKWNRGTKVDREFLSRKFSLLQDRVTAGLGEIPQEDELEVFFKRASSLTFYS